MKEDKKQKIISIEDIRKELDKNKIENKKTEKEIEENVENSISLLEEKIKKLEKIIKEKFENADKINIFLNLRDAYTEELEYFILENFSSEISNKEITIEELLHRVIEKNNNQKK